MSDISNKAKRKKKMLIAVIVMMSLLVIASIVIIVIDYIAKNAKPYVPGAVSYNFYEADYNEDIYKDEEYLELIAGDFVRYLDSATNRTVGIDEETAVLHGEDVVFMVDYIRTIVNGDVDKYNSMFSSEYYEKSEKKSIFTKQKLYDIQITKYSSEEIVTKDSSYTKCLYVVEYKIFKNNGTFRNDIGDGFRKQYITISDKSGSFLIDLVGYIKYE